MAGSSVGWALLRVTRRGMFPPNATTGSTEGAVASHGRNRELADPLGRQLCRLCTHEHARPILLARGTGLGVGPVSYPGSERSDGDECRGGRRTSRHSIAFQPEGATSTRVCCLVTVRAWSRISKPPREPDSRAGSWTRMDRNPGNSRTTRLDSSGETSGPLPEDYSPEGPHHERQRVKHWHLAKDPGRSAPESSDRACPHDRQGSEALRPAPCRSRA